MLYDAKEWGRHVEVTDVNGNIKENLSRYTAVTMWNGEGWGELFEGQIIIDHPYFKFSGFGEHLLQKHGLLVHVNGSNVATW